MTISGNNQRTLAIVCIIATFRFREGPMKPIPAPLVLALFLSSPPVAPGGDPGGQALPSGVLRRLGTETLRHPGAQSVA
jgi:hypothetical protein